MTRRTFCGAARTKRARARISPSVAMLGCRLRRNRLSHLVHPRRVPPERPRRRKLAQLVADHVLGDVDRDVAPAVVDSNGVAHHLRENRARPTPRPDDLLLPALVHLLDLPKELRAYERTLLQGSGHGFSASLVPSRAAGGRARGG